MPLAEAIDEPKTAKLFTNGASQAVRLPAEFRFDADLDRVYVRRDERTGDLILSAQPRSSWTEFMSLRAQLGPNAVPDDSLVDRGQRSEMRDPLAGGHE